MTAKKTEKKSPQPSRNTRATTEALRESEKTYRGIFECGGIPTVIIGEDYLIQLANDKFLELSGFSRGDVEGKKRWTEFVDTRDIEKTEKYIAEFLKPGGWAPAQFGLGFVDQNGSIRDVAASMNLLAGSRKIIISLVDLAPRKKVERMLRLNEERYRTLVRTLTAGVFRAIHELPGRFIWANPAFLSMFGYSSLSDLPGITIAGIMADARDQECVEKDLWENGFFRREKIRLKKADGSLLWAVLSLELRQNDEGTTAWIDGTVENITERVQAGEELKRTQSRLGELLDAVSTYGLFETDPDGILTMFNTGSERMLGYPAGDLIGRQTPLVFIHVPRSARTASAEEESPGNSFAAFASRARTHGCDEREVTFIRSDGMQVPVDLTLTVMHDETGAITGYLGVAEEISDQKRLEEAFRNDKLQMSGVIYNIPDPTFIIDRAGKVIAWNRAIEELSGIKAVDILGKGGYEHALPFYGERRPMLADLIFSPDDEIHRQGYVNIVRNENSVAAETCFAYAGGRSVRAIAAPLYDDSGEIAGGIESITDITEVVRRESELQNSESRFRAILDYIGSAVAILEKDFTISYINPEFERIIGFVHEEVETQRKWTEFIAPDDAERFGVPPAGCTDHAVMPVRGEFRFIRWDGEVRNGYLSVEPIPESGNSVLSLVDITDRIAAEEAVQRANEKLNFFSSITRHDILNQLTALKGNLELSRESGCGDEHIRTSIEKELAAAEGIQNLILFTRDYQDIGIQPPEWQDVREVIFRSCSGIRLRNITVTVLVSGVEIYADLLLERVFYHLLNNAILHGGESLTQIRFTGEESFDEFVLTCGDDGVGIPADIKEAIFTRRPPGDSGPGMFVSREILSITGIGIRENGTARKRGPL